jgi:uncharacterized phage protein gp47/JayE
MEEQVQRLLDQVRDAIRLKHYASCTEKTYAYWANAGPGVSRRWV